MIEAATVLVKTVLYYFLRPRGGLQTASGTASLAVLPEGGRPAVPAEAPDDVRDPGAGHRPGPRPEGPTGVAGAAGSGRVSVHIHGRGRTVE